jgi:hypothetical protein
VTYTRARAHTHTLTHKIIKGGDPGEYDVLAAMERHVCDSFNSREAAIRPTNIVDNLNKIGHRLRIDRQVCVHACIYSNV